MTFDLVQMNAKGHVVHGWAYVNRIVDSFGDSGITRKFHKEANVNLQLCQ